MEPVNLYAGYDPAEAAGYATFCHSVFTRSSIPVHITALAKNTFPAWRRTNTVDKPGSTEFSFSRFIVPFLNGYQGFALFMDGCDMLCLDDIKKLWDMRDGNYAVQVVKHAPYHATPDKMWGNRNEYYPRKNWSSVILFNCAHRSNRILTSEYVASATGEELHRFKWLRDEEIGEIPGRWNYLAGEQEHVSNPAVVHYTLGLPPIWSHGDDLDDLWYEERARMDNILPKITERRLVGAR